MSDATASQHYTVLIPAYKPDARMVDLVRTLREEGLHVLVVDDGSGEGFLPFFDQAGALGATVLRHETNQGKGRALKTGLAAVGADFPASKGVVTADADGQHTPIDILRVIEAMDQNPGALVLGERAFVGEVPFKSRAGNAITRFVYKLATGLSIHDTQTGLRGISAGSIDPMLQIEGERYEYEMNMLLKLRELGLPVAHVPIETVYIDQNASSHFHPFRDAARIYYTIARFAASSLICVGIDYALYLLLFRAFGLLEPFSYAIAKLVSSLFNFFLNKKGVFKSKTSDLDSLWRYYTLALPQWGIGALLVWLLSKLFVSRPLLIKIPVDVVLFFINFKVQRDWVFKDRSRAPQEDAKK